MVPTPTCRRELDRRRQSQRMYRSVCLLFRAIISSINRLGVLNALDDVCTARGCYVGYVGWRSFTTYIYIYNQSYVIRIRQRTPNSFRHSRDMTSWQFIVLTSVTIAVAMTTTNPVRVSPETAQQRCTWSYVTPVDGAF
jgi:hypothetical protein